MKIQFYNRDSFATFKEALESNAVYGCDTPVYEDEVERWGFNGGALCDVMQAVYAALSCAGVDDLIVAVLTKNGKVILRNDDEEEPAIIPTKTSYNPMNRSGDL